jgi:ABC-type lipoprotein release transport system permease subunit
MLFQVSALDLATYAGVVVLIVTIVSLASYLPARRAASVDPLELLKAD